MNLSSDFVADFWESVKPLVNKENREEFVEKLYIILQEYGTDPEDLKSAGHEDPILDIVWMNMFHDPDEDFYEDDEYE